MVFPASSSASATEMVENATREGLSSPDRTAVLAISKSINSNNEQAKDIVEAVGKRLHHDNQNVQSLTLKLFFQLLEGVVNNSQIAEKEKVEEMIKSVKEKILQADMQPTKETLVLPDSGASGPSGPSGPSDACVYVIGPQYCYPKTVKLEISREAESTLNFFVREANVDIFKVREKGIIPGVVLVHGADNVVHIKKQIPSLHERWVVYNGKNKPIFSVRRPEMAGEKTKLVVFLAVNKKEKVSNFNMEESRSKNLLIIYRGDSSTKIAEMHKKADEDIAVVKIDPKIDIAFIVTLVVIHECIKQMGKKKQNSFCCAGGAAVKCALAVGLHELFDFLTDLSG